MINSPSEDIKTLEQLSETLKKSVDIRQNSLTLLDADLMRIKNLIVAENYTINEQSKKKAELADQIDKLCSQLEIASNQLKDVSESLTSKNNELAKVQAELADVLASKEGHEISMAVKANEISAREVTVKKAADNLIEKAVALEAREAKVEAKHNALKELFSKLN